MKGSGCFLTGFNKPDFIEGIDDLANQVDDLLVLPDVEQHAKFAAQAFERRRPLFQQPQNMRARCSQQMRLPGVCDIDDALVVPASLQIFGRRAQAKYLQSVGCHGGKRSGKASIDSNRIFEDCKANRRRS